MYHIQLSSNTCNYSKNHFKMPEFTFKLSEFHHFLSNFHKLYILQYRRHLQLYHCITYTYQTLMLKDVLKVPDPIASGLLLVWVFFKLSEIWYQKKAHIFLTTLSELYMWKCTIWKILMKIWLVALNCN